MATLKTPAGIRLYYEVHGQGEPLLMLGGIMMNTSSWGLHLPYITPHAQVILMDFRDQARSDKMKTDYDLQVHVDDIGHLLDELKLPKVHLLGVSYGGMVALLFALHHPERVQSLILANTLHYIPYHLQAIGRAWEVAGELNDATRFFELVLPYIYSNSFYATHYEFLRERQKMFASFLTQDWFDGFRRLCRSAYNFSIPPSELQKLAIPVLLIGADEDHVTPLPLMMEMHRLMPQAEFLVIPRAGHGAVIERPREFLTAVVGFIRRHGMKKGGES